MQDEKNRIESNAGDEQEIDLLELARKLWASRRFILKWSGIAAIVGLVVAFSIPKEYTTTIKLSPESSGSKSGGGGLGALAAMAGFSAGGSSSADAVYPQLYPDVVGSVPFVVDLFDVKVNNIRGDQSYTVREYLEKETSAPWWSFFMSLPGKTIGAVKSIFSSKEESEGDGNVNTFRLTPEENAVVLALTQRVAADVDSKTSVITLSATMQDPMVSAMLVDTVAERLKEYITNYRTSKARADLEYAQTLNDEAKADYYKAQQRYADYVDRNQGVVLQSAQTERERLQNEMSLAYDLYNQTAQRLQLAKAKVQETAPVYVVVQPATVPLKPSKPSKMLILVGFIFLGFVASSAYVLFGRDIVASFRNNQSGDKAAEAAS